MILLENSFIVILGLIFGSFIAALTYRYPRNISNNSGRSFCDSCKKQLSWKDNIPLLSYLFLGGKSRCCGKSVSPRYPIIELATSIGFFLLLTFKGFTLQGVILFLILESIFIIDFEHQIIPDDFIFFGIFVALIANPHSLIANLLAGLICASFLLLIHLFTKGRGMGLGDVKFAVLGGILVGLNLSLIWLFVAFLTGGLIGIILILSKSAKLKDKIAFGPFLAAAIPITLIWGQKIIDIMLSR